MEQQKLESAQTVAGSRSADKKRKVSVGSVWESRNFGAFEVVDYRGCHNVVVRFIETGFETRTTANYVRVGVVKDRLARSVCGVGFIGHGRYQPTANGKISKSYSQWKDMIVRCYDENLRHKHPTYKDCTVCDEWHNFQNFAEWHEANYPKDGKPYQLDKDLKVIGNKVYSPETCMFVSSAVNKFTVDCGSSRGEHMVGVCKPGERLIARCRNPITGKHEHLGLFDNELKAHLAWRNRKSWMAYELAMTQDMSEVKQALLNWKRALDSFEIHRV